jgi:hypothetical protein
MADAKQSSQTQPEGRGGYDGYDGREPAWVPHLIKALEGLRTNVRELTDAQKAIIVEHAFLKERLAGPLIAPPGPVVSTFDPTSGVPGSPVTVVGKGFTTALAVHFAGTRSSDLQIRSDTLLTTKVPASAVTGPLTVFTADGAGTSRDSFTVTDDQSQAQPQSQSQTKASARSGA